MINNYLLKTQYRTAKHLNKRISLHQTFSTTKYTWYQWVFDQLNFPAKAKILELGCGPANLWSENYQKIPKDWDITLSDFSLGMINQARKNLKGKKNFSYQRVNAESIPFANETFDMVIANHMLYHLPNLTKTLIEVSRVLKPNGYFIAATNGKTHLKELQTIEQLFGFVRRRDFIKTKSFNLENGKIVLSKYFKKVRLYRYQEKILAITKTQPLIDYIESVTASKNSNAPAALKRYLDARMKKYGSIKISRSSGLFTARK